MYLSTFFQKTRQILLPISPSTRYIVSSHIYKTWSVSGIIPKIYLWILRIHCQSAFNGFPLSASNCDLPLGGGTGGEAPPPGQPAVWPGGCLPFHRCLMIRSCYIQRDGSNSDADSPLHGSSLHAFQHAMTGGQDSPMLSNCRQSIFGALRDQASLEMQNGTEDVEYRFVGI